MDEMNGFSIIKIMMKKFLTRIQFQEFLLEEASWRRKGTRQNIFSIPFYLNKNLREKEKYHYAKNAK